MGLGGRRDVSLVLTICLLSIHLDKCIYICTPRIIYHVQQLKIISLSFFAPYETDNSATIMKRSSDPKMIRSKKLLILIIKYIRNYSHDLKKIGIIKLNLPKSRIFNGYFNHGMTSRGVIMVYLYTMHISKRGTSLL